MIYEFKIGLEIESDFQFRFIIAQFAQNEHRY